MEWLKPITEKLNANIFITAIALTSIGWWYFSRYDFLIALGTCCAIYLIILFFYTIIKFYIDKKKAEEREAKSLEAMVEEDKIKNLRIDVWFAALHKQHIDNLLKLMTWNTLPNAVNIKIFSPDKEWLSFNDEEFIIDMGVYEQPIRLLYQIENLSSNSYKTYYIHPHLIKLLTDYKANNR